MAFKWESSEGYLLLPCSAAVLYRADSYWNWSSDEVTKERGRENRKDVSVGK